MSATTKQDELGASRETLAHARRTIQTRMMPVAFGALREAEFDEERVTSAG